MTTGELLFGRFGIDGVSLREIGVAAGQTNSSVVQYHFKDKRGLVISIINDRFARLEPLRREQLDSLGTDATDPRELLRILWAPMITLRGPDGEHPFCRFLLQYVLQPQGPAHPNFDPVAYRRSRRVPAHLPQMARLRRLLRGRYGQLSASAYDSRLTAVGLMFLSTMVEHDNARLLAPAGKFAEFDLELILDLAIAAMAAAR
jgi:AcrR family transcriptional regulator